MGDRGTVSNLRRSASMSMRTPQHRPSYATRTSRSPGNRTPLSVAGVTSNSEQNRRQATENTAKVIELLQTDRTFFNRLNLGNVGLKSMSSKQFLEIMSFFMMKIAGKNFLSKSQPNNHDDVILTFIQDLKYPFSVHKTCFKSPNSHHFFPEVVAILAFFSDLIGDIKKSAASVKMPLKSCDRLLNDDFTQLFSAEALSYYRNYDPKHMLDNDSEARMINRFIGIKLKINQTITIDELAEKTIKLQQSNEQLQQNLIETDVQKCFSSISQQVRAHETELQNLQEILNEKRTHFKMVMLKHDERAAELRTKQTICDDLIEKIQNQNYTTLDIKQLMAKETTIKSSIAMIQGETEAIKVQASDAQVKLARLQKLKLDSIKRFNEITFGIAQKLMESSSFRKINVNEYTIDPAAPMSNIQTVCMHLKLLKESCAAIKRQFHQKIQQNNEKLSMCTAQSEQLTANYTADMAKFQLDSKKFDEIHQQCTKYKSDGSTNETRMQHEIHYQIAYKKQLMKQIDELQMKMASLKAENIKLLNIGERKSREIVRAKQAAIKQMDGLCDFIDDLLGDDDDDDGDNAHNNQNDGAIGLN